MPLHPLLFHPIPQTRVWGGRKLAELYGRPLPPGPIGESWEISDRPGAVSVIAAGPLAGRDLRWVMENHSAELLGGFPSAAGRFPWLVKIIDAREDLSLQVHPPAALAASLGGDPKSELWFAADAAPGAQIYAGLRRGVTRASFENAIRTGAVADCFHPIPWRRGDALFLPSGRPHALGAGSLIFEIQQNSDTTYRVFDWNRTGLDGKPRELHIDQSLASIDFSDIEPSLEGAPMASRGPGCAGRTLVDCPIFRIDHLRCEKGAGWRADFARGPVVVGVVAGDLAVDLPTGPVVCGPGGFVLLPSSAPGGVRQLSGPLELLAATPA
jgi:mannose-6-phosphate isomerase